VKNVEATAIGMTEVERGIALADHYATEALRLFAASQADAELVRAQELLRWLLISWDGDVVGLPEIYQFGPNFVRDKRTSTRLVALLEDHGHLDRIVGGAVIGEHKRKDAWRIVGKATS
jgi:hypothetical protein